MKSPRRGALVLVEEAWQVERIRGLPDLARTTVVAISPEACHELERAGIAFHVVDDFYSPSDLVDLAFKVSHPRLDEICRRGDEVVLGTSAICRAEDMEPFTAHHYHLMSVLDAVVLAAHALGRIVEATDPSAIAYFPAEPEPLNPALAFTSESIYAQLAPLVARQRGLEALPLEAGFAEGRRWPWRVASPWSAGAAQLRRLARRGLRSMRALGRQGFRVARRHVVSGNRPRLLVLDLGYDVDAVLQCLAADGWPSPVVWREAGLTGSPPLVLHGPDVGVIDLARERRLLAECARDGQCCLQVARSDRRFRALFEFEGIDLFELVERRLAALLTRNLPWQLDTRLKAQALFAKYGIDGVLATDITSFGRIEVARAARERGIAVVVYQHGGACGYSHAYAHETTALKWADYFLAYGEGVASYFNERRADPSSPVRAQSIPVGSAKLDAVARAVGQSQRHREVRRVVWVRHQLPGRNRRLPYCDYDANRYWRWQKQIVDVFQHHPEVEVVVRPFPSLEWPDPLVGYLGAATLPNFRVERVRPFSSLVGEADLFVLDYDGTPMLEALTTDRPIIVLAEEESTWIHPPARALLEKRVVYARSIQEYLRRIEDALSASGTLRPRMSDEFLRSYGTHKNDGQSAGRAAAALAAIVARRETGD